MNCKCCGAWFSSSDASQELCIACRRALARVEKLFNNAEPVRHGCWKSRGNFLVCSECEHEFTKYNWEGSVVSYYWCPNCGAKMHIAKAGE